MKKNIGRVMVVLFMTAACLLSACQTEKNEITEQQIEKTEKNETEPTDVVVTNSSEQIYVYNDTYVYDDFDEDLGDWVSLTEKMNYELKLTSDTEAELSITEFRPDQPDYIITHYNGSYKKEENEIVFTYATDSDIYAFTIENDNVIDLSVYNYSNITEDLSGTYTGTSNEIGDFTLTIDKYFQATITTAEYELGGHVFLYDSQYDLIANNDDYGINIDWYITLNDGIVTYVPFGTDYSQYAGEYTIFGSLGTYTLLVDDEGNCSVEMIIDGEYQYLTGYIYGLYDDTIAPFTYAYLESDSYNLELEFVDINHDGSLNYSGSLRIPLNAG